MEVSGVRHVWMSESLSLCVCVVNNLKEQPFCVFCHPHLSVVLMTHSDFQTYQP